MSKNHEHRLRISTEIFSVALLFLFIASTSVAFADFDITKWPSYRDLNVPASTGFVKVTLPETISSGGNNFSDIRIVTQENNIEVPYFITRNAVLRSGEVSGQIIDQTAINGAESFIVDTNVQSGIQGDIHTGIRIDSPSLNFRRRISVYSSATLLPLGSSSWNLVTDKGYAFKFTDPNTSFSSGKNLIDFPANTSRYLKVVIDAGPEGPVSVSNVSVYGETRIDVPSYDKEVSISTFNNPKNKTSEVTLDLGESGHITDSVTLNTSDRNFSRRVIIEAGDISTSTSWKYVGESSISSIQTSLFSGTSLEVKYPEQKTRYIRVSVVNDDNRPLIIGKIARVEGPIISAIFETRVAESYRLYYGNPLGQTPNYDISRISSYVETNKLPAGSIGSEITNPLYMAPPAPVVPFTEANKGLLDIFLVIIVMFIGGGIGWYLYSYVKGKGVGFKHN